MEEVTTIGLDLAKLVFQAHGADGSGAVVFRKTLRRHKVLAFFASQPPCLVAMEASGINKAASKAGQMSAPGYTPSKPNYPSHLTGRPQRILDTAAARSPIRRRAVM